MTRTEKWAKGIRVLTAAPFFALLLCVWMYAGKENAFASWRHFAAAVFFLTLLPLLSYPTAYWIPAMRKKGREGERNLAIVFSIAGYIAGFGYSALCGGTGFERVLYGTYLLSGMILAGCTAVHYKASGHASGCSGPIAMLSVFFSPWCLTGYWLMLPIIWSSLKLRRHTLPQLAVGMLIPVVEMFLCRWAFL